MLTGVLLLGSLFILATRMIAPRSAADQIQVPAEAALPAPQPGHLAVVPTYHIRLFREDLPVAVCPCLLMSPVAEPVQLSTA